MKKIISISLFLATVMLIMPLTAMTNMSEGTKAAVSAKAEEITDSITPSDEFKVYDPSSEKITVLSSEDYIFGVVAAEMPALYEVEALKAQAVAAYTFACARKSANSDKQYDITADPTTDQCYISESTASDKWGDKAEEYTSKIKAAVKETAGYAVTYNGSLITAVYHAVSTGKTESCKNVWGTDLPYLVPVESEGDRLASDYISTVTLSFEEIKKSLAEKITFPEDGTVSFSGIVRTDSGNVKSIDICNQTLSGFELRELLNLRSADFEPKITDNTVTFTVYGYGHGVGMSQNGANYMAKLGYDFKSILTHYYTDCKVEKLS